MRSFTSEYFVNLNSFFKNPFSTFYGVLNLLLWLWSPRYSWLKKLSFSQPQPDISLIISFLEIVFSDIYVLYYIYISV